MNRVIDILGRFLNAVSGVLIVVMCLAMFVQVILRYLTNRSSGVVEEGLPMLMIWMSMLVCGLIYFNGHHINTDFALTLVKGRRLAALKVSISLIVIIFAVIFGLSGWQQTQVMIALGQRSGTSFSYPLWTREISLVVGMVLLAFYGIIDLIRNCRDLFTGARTEFVRKLEG